MEVELERATIAREMLYGANLEDQSEWAAGSTEPWIVHAMRWLIVAAGARRVIEIGGFQGFASKRIAHALSTLPWRTHFTVCEIDPDRALAIDAVFNTQTLPEVERDVVCADSLEWIPTLPNESVDAAWIDGNHEKAHVYQEVGLLLAKMRPGGLLLLHDVWGVCDLQEVTSLYKNAIALDFPRLGPAGGLGIIQVR